MSIKVRKGGVWVEVSSGEGGGGSLVKLGTVATTSGTEAAFTSIPSTAKKITVAIHNFGFSGSADDFIMQVGDSGGYATTGYQSSYDSTDAVNVGRTDAYGLTPGTDSGLEYNITVELVNVTGNSWTISHVGGSNTGLGSVIYGGGSISLSNALDKLKIKTVNGRTLDNGHITVYYETEGSSGSGSGIGTTKVALLSDVKSSGTDGGTFTAGSWVDRTLNTEVDPQNFVTLDSGNVYWSLEAGTYRITWSTPAYNTNSHASALLYSTSNTFSSSYTAVEGSSEFDSAGIEPNSQTRSFGDTIITVSQTTYFKIQHKCTFSQSTNGLGNATGLQTEVYTQVSIQDLSTSASSGGGGGGIVQVISVTKTDVESLTSTSTETLIPGMEATITPKSSSNKILVMVTLNASVGDQYAGHYAVLKRGSTNIAIGDAAGNRNRVSISLQAPCFYDANSSALYGPGQTSIQFLDSPTTTSATTYGLYHADPDTNNALYINRSRQDTDDHGFNRIASSITLMEVSG